MPQFVWIMKVLCGYLVKIIKVIGTGNKTNFNVPQKLFDIPPVVSVSCGSEHTLIITNDDHLWSCGNNDGILHSFGFLSFIISEQQRRNICMWF